ncbi:MAG: hypothetical protein ACHQ50_17885 [Fimbriimonadales bacterium]
MGNLVNLLANDLLPRLRAEEIVLLPLFSTEQQSSHEEGLDSGKVSRLAEAISALAVRPTASDTKRVQRVVSAVLTVLGEQRQAEARLVGRIRALPASDRGAAGLGDRLEAEAQASRMSQFFISEADRLPTEAWVLRHNPKPARIGLVARSGPSPVADLVAVLAVA